MMSYKIVILTGAGISAESGLHTFRGQDGMWEHERIEDVATPEGYYRDKKRVKDFYNTLRNGLPQHKPNAAHLALAELEKHFANDFLLITQNVDDLHERAGSKRILHMHGELLSLRCERNPQHVFPFSEEETMKTECPFCGAMSRPNIVWFGEQPLYMDEIQEALTECKLFAYIGTSGVVYPAAGFKNIAKHFGAKVVCLNLDIDEKDSSTDEYIQGKAGETVPKWVQSLIK